MANMAATRVCSPYVPPPLSANTRDNAEVGRDAFAQGVPVFADWVKLQQKNVKKIKGVYTAWGRWIAIPDANIKTGEVTSRGKRVSEGDANAIRAACERHSINYPIQGSGADIMKLAMNQVQEAIELKGLRSRMLLQVHDELVFEVFPGEVVALKELVLDKMSNVVQLSVPLEVQIGIGKSWDKAAH
jgi:DNA polymerase-1